MKKVLCYSVTIGGLLLAVHNANSAPLPARRPKELASFQAHTHVV